MGGYIRAMCVLYLLQTCPHVIWTSQGNKQLGLWEDLLEGFENLPVVTCNASTPDVISLTVYEILNDTELSLVFYKSASKDKECWTFSSLQSCFYDDVTITLRVIVNLEIGETKRYKCDLFFIPDTNAGNPKTDTYYINITKENSTITSLNSGITPDLSCIPVWTIDAFWKLFIASSVLMFIFAAISVVLGCLLRRCQDKLRKEGYYSITCDPLPQENNFRKKKEKTIEHIKTTHLCTSSTVDFSSILGNNTTPPDCPPPVVPGSTRVMQYERSALDSHPSVGRDDDKHAVASSVYYQEPWDNIDKKLQEISENLGSSHIFYNSDVTYSETTE